MATIRGILFGRPLSSAADLSERLPKWKALPVFSSDVMSSVAYATGAMMLILAGAGTDNYKYVLGLSVVVVALLVIVTFSYRQTIRAYPNGGGSYIVAHANLGVLAGLVAAGSLLTDYVLTVSVSVSSGVQALYSAFPLYRAVRRAVDRSVDSARYGRQSARPSGERHAVRQPHLHLHRLDVAAHRGRDLRVR